MLLGIVRTIRNTQKHFVGRVHSFSTLKQVVIIVTTELQRVKLANATYTYTEVLLLLRSARFLCLCSLDSSSYDTSPFPEAHDNIQWMESSLTYKFQEARVDIKRTQGENTYPHRRFPIKFWFSVCCHFKTAAIIRDDFILVINLQSNILLSTLSPHIEEITGDLQSVST
jgi:hypothetical protein